MPGRAVSESLAAASGSGPAALELTEVTRRFGDTVAVDRLSLRLEPGAFVGLLGRNGAGKSTILKMATTLLPPTSGTVRVLGRSGETESDSIEIRKRIGAMPEDMALLELMSGPQYLRFVGRMYGLADEVIEARSRELFDTLELAPAPGLSIADFSYGMKKKLSLASALLHAPSLLFLDEPFEGIDPVAARTIRNILETLRRRGVTLILTSHVLEIVEKLCPLIAIVDRGKLMGFGSLDQIRTEHGRGGDLESLFVDLMGGERQGTLSWL